MSQTAPEVSPFADVLRRAYATRDLAGLSTLLADDVRWGDEEHPRKCRSRSDVLARFADQLAVGVTADVTEVTHGRLGVLCGLRVHRPDATANAPERCVYHVYVLTGQRIAEIRSFDDRRSAVEAADVPTLAP